MTERGRRALESALEGLALPPPGAGHRAAGLFGPTSIAWRLCRERAVVLMAPRAVMLQYAHPAFAAASHHYGTASADPGARFSRAVRTLLAMVFGDARTAVKHARRVERLHGTLSGVLVPGATGGDLRRRPRGCYGHGRMRQPGSTLGPYVVESLLAEGGMGAVYRAKNRVTGQLRAIKVVRPELVEKRDFVDRFVREATIASQLRHPNLVETLEPGIDGTIIYLPMELLEGDTLSVFLKKKKRLTPTEAAEILVPVTQAVQLLHDKGVVHRDLKPMNIFITRGPGGAIVPKVIDLGTARDVEDEEHTRTGMVVGSPFYMSPEQAEGRRDIDGRADQYALGVIAYQMITGARPYESDDTRSALAKLLRGEPYVPPSRYFPGLHPSVEAVIVRALARDRDRRFARIDELGRALTDAAAGLPVPSAALPPPAILPPGIHEVPTAPPGVLDARGPGAPSSMPPPGAPNVASPLGTPGPFAPPPDGPPGSAAPRSRAPLMIGAVVVLALLGAGAAALTWSMSPTMTATPLAPRATTPVGGGPAPVVPPITITTTPLPDPVAPFGGAPGASVVTEALAAGTGAAGSTSPAPGGTETTASPDDTAAAGTTGASSAPAAGTARTAPATTDADGRAGAGAESPTERGGTAGTSSSGTTRTSPGTTDATGSSGGRRASSTTTAAGGSSPSSGTASGGEGRTRGTSGSTRHDDDDDDERGGGASHGAPCGAATGIPCLE